MLVSIACLLLLACSSQEPQGSPGGSGGGTGSDAGSPVDGTAIDEGHPSCPGNCGVTTYTSAPSDCTFNFAMSPSDPSNVKVLGMVGTMVVTIPQGDPDGWVYGPGFLAITLDGAACQQVRDGTLTDLRVLFGCPSCPIP